MLLPQLSPIDKHPSLVTSLNVWFCTSYKKGITLQSVLPAAAVTINHMIVQLCAKERSAAILARILPPRLSHVNVRTISDNSIAIILTTNTAGKAV